MAVVEEKNDHWSVLIKIAGLITVCQRTQQQKTQNLFFASIGALKLYETEGQWKS